MIELESALDRAIRITPRLGSDRLKLIESAGYFLNDDVICPTHLPPFDNSAMDGFAVRSSDVISASDQSPVVLRVSGMTPAGTLFETEVAAGCCVKVMTGSALPAGTDAVVMKEDTRLIGDSTVQILDRVRPWEHVRLRGEDVKSGEVIAQAGQRLSAGTLAVLSSSGVEFVTVAQRPQVGIVATGSELIELGNPIRPGRIHESNRIMLAELVRKSGGQPTVFPLVEDKPDAIRKLLEHAFNSCDIVITTGGVSVGEFDFVKDVFSQMGGAIDLWRVNIKPGKPFVLGSLRDKVLFGLPGNPVSAFVTYLLLVRPTLLAMQGATQLALPSHPSNLAEPLVNRGNRRHFMRVHVDSHGNVRSAGLQASHALGSLSRANGLVDVAPETVLAAGSTVSVLRWDMET